MKPIATASLLKAALFAGVAAGSLLSGAAAANAEVGVAAAVNVDAKGRPPGAAPRVISLGSNVVFNEEITTDSAGLVQILLLDGTTFTVGPNSQLTIDEFVYNPDTGDAKVVASLTKGVFRFVGARTSQTEGGATVRTPVGTIGIRGAVTNISYDPSTGQSTAALVAGNKLTITDGDGTRRIVYETGYTAVITRDANGGTSTLIRKSTKEEAGLIQQQLSSKPGQHGGTNNPPDDDTVDDSGLNDINSGLPDHMIVPGFFKPVQSSEPDQVEETAGMDGKTQDDVDNSIESPTTTYSGFFSGMGESEEGPYALTSAPIYCEGQDCEGESNLTLQIDADGNPISGEGTLEDSYSDYYYQSGQNPVVKKIVVGFGGQTELHTDTGGVAQPQEVETFIVSGRTTPMNEIYDHCEECDFIQWGWWGTTIETAANPGQGVPEDRVDVVKGTWVAGDISTPDAAFDESALPFGGSAEYNGTAIGTVARGDDPTYVATGDFNMTYNFAGRWGEASINNFDGDDDYDLSGPVFDYSNDSQALFAGQIWGGDTPDGFVSGDIQGAFVNDGPNVAAGAIGNFSFSGDGVNVVGTVAGVGSPISYDP